MIIEKIIDFEMDENCYILYKKGCSVCLLIDPGANYSKIINYLEEKNLQLSHILLTHCHYDHISSIKELKEKTAAVVLSGEECKENIKSNIINVSMMFGKDLSGDFVDETFSDREEKEIAGIKVKCIKTPGHTNCSVCYQIDDNIFSGDTLFLRTTGRWDLPTGDFDTLKESIQNKLYKMDEHCKVFPGHGNSTTIGYEKKYNLSISNQD